MREQTRKLRVGPRTYFWRVLHRHGADGAPCTDLLSLRSDAPRSAPLLIAFPGGPGRLVGDGMNPNGVVIRWMFEDEPRALLATPRRWHRRILRRPGAFA